MLSDIFIAITDQLLVEIAMLEQYSPHNRFKQGFAEFESSDPHLFSLAKLKIQYSPNWWNDLDLKIPGIYILTGGRQVGKSTSCKLLIKDCLEKKIFLAEQILYLPCDEIFDAKELSRTIRLFVNEVIAEKFLLIIDEITFVKNWDRVIKSLADEGAFQNGTCLLTGSDSLILKEAAMRFPGRRGKADQVDFHLYPLLFNEYVNLVSTETPEDDEQLFNLFMQYLNSGGYLKAINDLEEIGEISQATFLTYEQWIRGDFLKHGKKEEYLISILKELLTVGVSQISYSKLTQRVGILSKETCIDYANLLERMDVIFNLQAFDQNKKQGFPRKERKFHFMDPFIQRTIYNWLQREGYINSMDFEAGLVEACVANYCNRTGKAFYFKGQGEVDVIKLQQNKIMALEVKWGKQLRANDLKMLKNFRNSLILTRGSQTGKVDGITCVPVYKYLLGDQEDK